MNNNVLSLFGAEDKIDTHLPIIKNIRTINDVKSVGFEWESLGDDDISLINGFVLYRVQKGGGIKKIAVIKNPLATHYYDNALAPQTNYTYQISTLGKNGHVSPRSPLIQVKTSFIDPVESVFATQKYPKEIKIIWSPHPNPSISRYIIQRQNQKGEFLNIGVVKNRLYVEYFDKDLEDGKEYKYRVIAESFEGAKSLPSVVGIGKTKSRPLPLLGLKVSTNLAREIQIYWDKSPQKDVIKYKIYAGASPKDHFKLIGETTQTTYTDKINTDGIQKFYKVVPVDKTGIQGELPLVALEGSTLGKPPTPVILKGVVVKGEGIIQWQKISNPAIKSYAIYRYEDGFSSKPLRFRDIVKNEFIDKEMKKGKVYHYQVVSVDKNGLESLPSKEVKLLVNE
ncbi:hypothetical protein BKH45_05140 [Helicobacter sp. 11S03491-1]|nr:hypothetical protein BKH45_05140 [Helicobacter sp. 11S03491-1]